jgi:hypothetical protein
MFSGAAFTPLAPLMEAVLTSQLQLHAARRWPRWTCQRSKGLEAERRQLEERIAGQGRHDADAAGWREQQDPEGPGRAGEGPARPPSVLRVERAMRSCGPAVAGAPELATEAQLHDEARGLADSAEMTLDALRHRVGVLVERLPTSLREVASGVQTYLVGVRNDQERFLYVDPPKSFERIEEMLPPVLGLPHGWASRFASAPSAWRRTWRGCGRRVELNAFTTSFPRCATIRQGASTLQKLNRELKNISLAPTPSNSSGPGAAAAEGVRFFRRWRPGDSLGRWPIRFAAATMSIG